MKRQGLKSLVILLLFSFFITLASAGNVVFRDGKIISSGNVSTDEKFVGDGSALTNLSSGNNNEFNQTVNILGNASNAYNFATLQLYQNATTSLNNPIWQITHRSESLFKNSMIWYFFNGSTWLPPPLVISPNLNIGINTQTPRAKLEVNGSVLILGNLTAQNVSSLHQTYNVTANTALDTTYNNTFDRPIYVDFTFLSFISTDSDGAYLTMYVNGTYCAREGESFNAQQGFTIQQEFFNHLGCYVQPGQKYSFNSTVVGSGSITREKVYLTVI